LVGSAAALIPFVAPRRAAGVIAPWGKYDCGYFTELPACWVCHQHEQFLLVL